MTTPPLDLTAERLTALRDVANAATPGEWWSKQFEPNVIDLFAGDGSGDNPGVAEAWHPEDAAHIVAFDPPTALALLDTVDELSAERDSWRSRAESVSTARNLLHVENENVRQLNRDLARTGASLTARAEAAEAKVAAVREALTEVQDRGNGIAGMENNGSNMSRERAARGDGYLEATRIALQALDGGA